MSALTIPFIVKSSSPLLTWCMLALTAAAIVFVTWQMIRHHHGHRKAKKLGHNRRHDGRHGNH